MTLLMIVLGGACIVGIVAIINNSRSPSPNTARNPSPARRRSAASGGRDSGAPGYAYVGGVDGAGADCGSADSGGGGCDGGGGGGGD